MKKKTNISVKNSLGYKVTPSMIIGPDNGYVSGDILDANATVELINQVLVNDDEEPSYIDSIKDALKDLVDYKVLVNDTTTSCGQNQVSHYGYNVTLPEPASINETYRVTVGDDVFVGSPVSDRSGTYVGFNLDSGYNDPYKSSGWSLAGTSGDNKSFTLYIYVPQEEQGVNPITMGGHIDLKVEKPFVSVAKLLS